MRRVMIIAALAAAAAAPAVAQEEALNRDDVRQILQDQGYEDIGAIRQYYTARVRGPEGESVTVLVDSRTQLVRDAESGRITEQAAVGILEDRGLEVSGDVRWLDEQEAYRLDARRDGEEIVAEVHGFTGEVRQVPREEARGEEGFEQGDEQQAEVPAGIPRAEGAFE